MSGVLGGRVFRSGLLVTASSLAVRLLHLAALAVLARLLHPQDFGVVALAVVVVTTSSLFSAVGMGSAVIASATDTRRAAYHASVLNAGLGGALFVAAFALADPLAGLLGAAGHGDVFRWMSVVILIETLMVVPDALVMKDLRFGRRALVHLAAGAGQVAVSVALAVAGAGIWSLVAGHVVAALTRCVGVVLIAPRTGWLRPQRWDRATAREMLRFGGAAMATSVVRHVYGSLDRVVVGRLFGTVSLGFYSQSHTITNIPVMSVSQVTNSVLLPAYTQVRDDPARLAEGYVRAFRLVAALTVPLAVGLLILAPEMVVTLLGERWTPAVPILQVLAGMALFRPLSGTTSPLFLAVGRPGLNLATALVQLVAMVALMAALHTGGAVGIAAAVTTAFVLGFAFNLWQVHRRTGVPVRPGRLVGGTWPIVCAAAAMGAVVFAARQAVTAAGWQLPAPLVLGTFVALGVASYGAALLVLDRATVAEVARLVRPRGTKAQALA